MNKIERIKELTKELNQYRNEYYNLNKPTVKDSAYDEKFDELSILEKETGLVLSNSPTVTIGYEVSSKLNKIEHSIPLLSLNKTKDIKEIVKFIGGKDVIAMLKADGLTVELIYEHGSLRQASTRGNGFIGEEITMNAKVFKGIPLKINYQRYLKITGEAIIHKNDFDEINLKLPDEEKYATPRNLCAGSCRQLDNKICAARNVNFLAFALLECAVEFKTKSEQFKWLQELGFTVIPFRQIYLQDLMCLGDIVEQLKTLASEKFIPIDGEVISFDDVKYSKSLGVTNHHKLDGLAFKFKDESEVTILREIEWSVGRTGQITPVAKFDKVILDNTEVTRASVHNLSIMEELELGILDSISIYKANMIIPQIEENFTRSSNIIIPKVCPVCGYETIIKQLNESKVLCCTNENCSAKIIKKFSHFVSRNALNIDGLSDATLEKFIEEGFIETFSDIYKLKQYKSEIIKLEGFGIRSYTKLIEAIEKSKSVEMSAFLYALGIDQIGKGGAKRLAKYFNNNIDKFLEATILPMNFNCIDDFGDVTAISIYVYFKNEDNINQVKELLKYVNIKKEEKKVITNSKSVFAGCKVYCTGSFASHKKEELKSILEGLGAEFGSGYAKSLNYLIVGSLKGSSKEDKAKKDGVPILTEEQFLEMIK